MRNYLIILFNYLIILSNYSFFNPDTLLLKIVVINAVTILLGRTIFRFSNEIFLYISLVFFCFKSLKNNFIFWLDMFFNIADHLFGSN